MRAFRHGHSIRVDDHIGTLGHFIRIGNACDVPNLPAQRLLVAPRHVPRSERTTGRAGRLRRTGFLPPPRDSAHPDAARSTATSLRPGPSRRDGEQASDGGDPRDVHVTIPLAEYEPFGEEDANVVAVEDLHRPHRWQSIL